MRNIEVYISAAEKSNAPNDPKHSPDQILSLIQTDVHGYGHAKDADGQDKHVDRATRKLMDTIRSLWKDADVQLEAPYAQATNIVHDTKEFKELEDWARELAYKKYQQRLAVNKTYSGKVAEEKKAKRLT